MITWGDFLAAMGMTVLVVGLLALVIFLDHGCSSSVATR
jgi:hypothetical protein